MSRPRRPRRNPYGVRDFLLGISDLPQRLMALRHALDAGGELALLQVLDQLLNGDPLPHNVSKDQADLLIDSLMLELARFGSKGLVARATRILPGDSLYAAMIRAMAMLGLDSCISPCRQACAEPQDDVLSRLIWGLTNGRSRGERSPSFVSAMFEALERVLRTATGLAAYGIPKALAAIDPLKAADVLEEHALSEIRPLHLSRVLDVLIELDARPAAAWCENIESRWTPTSPDDERWSVYVRIARLAVASDPNRARKILHAALDNPNLSVREFAVDSLLIVNGMFPLYINYAWAEYESWPPQRRVVADVAGAMLEVGTNGVSGVFVNRPTLWWRTVAASLETIGAEHSLAILSNAAELLGLSDPNLTDEDVSEWRWPPGNEADAVDGTLTAQWYRNDDRREVLLYRYVMRHSEVFRRE
ncbi:MAG: DUF4375 domain-containing protein [Phycisphaerales bacterium]|nr:DUF4375 domain-containing protein [Phycisphaerales bacterium]